MKHLLDAWSRRIAVDSASSPRPAHPSLGRVFAADVDDYQGSHGPSSDGPPAHDLLGPGSFAPDDVYEHPDYYTGFRELIADTMRTLKGVRGKPGATVTIYRSVPAGITEINTGDWVTLSKAYATQHGYNDDGDWPVLSAQVQAQHVLWPGDDLMEWGYFGPDIQGRTAKLAFNGTPTEAERVVAAAIRDMHGGLIDIKRVGEIANEAANDDHDEAMRLIRNAMEWWDYTKGYRDRNGDRFTRTSAGPVAMAAMQVTWWKGEVGDDEWLATRGKGNYCLDHGFAKYVEMQNLGFNVERYMHHNYGEGCEAVGPDGIPCFERSPMDDPRALDIQTSYLDRLQQRNAAERPYPAGTSSITHWFPSHMDEPIPKEDYEINDAGPGYVQAAMFISYPNDDEKLRAEVAGYGTGHYCMDHGFMVDVAARKVGLHPNRYMHDGGAGATCVTCRTVDRRHVIATATRYFHGTDAKLYVGDHLEQGKGSNSYAVSEGSGVFVTDSEALAYFYAVLGPLQSGRFGDPVVYEVEPENARPNNPGEWVCDRAKVIRDVTVRGKVAFKLEWESTYKPAVMQMATDPATQRILLFEFERRLK